jgi:hypothetical protein
MRGGCCHREMRRGRESDIAVGKRRQIMREESIAKLSSIRIRALEGK